MTFSYFVLTGKTQIQCALLNYYCAMIITVDKLERGFRCWKVRCNQYPYTFVFNFSVDIPSLNDTLKVKGSFLGRNTFVVG